MNAIQFRKRSLKSIGLLGSFLFSVFLQTPVLAEDYGSEPSEDASSNFTMRVCGTLEQSDLGKESPSTYFVQDKDSGILFLMNGILPKKDSPQHFYMESQFLPDSSLCNIKMVITPDAIPLGEEHCWYTTYDKSTSKWFYIQTRKIPVGIQIPYVK